MNWKTISVFFVLAGCNTVQYGPTKTIQLDGKTMEVNESITVPNQWFAFPGLRGLTSLGDSSEAILRVRAIEIASGCAVIPSSIVHENGTTTAIVSCSNSEIGP